MYIMYMVLFLIVNVEVNKCDYYKYIDHSD